MAYIEFIQQRIHRRTTVLKGFLKLWLHPTSAGIEAKQFRVSLHGRLGNGGPPMLLNQIFSYRNTQKDRL